MYLPTNEFLSSYAPVATLDSPPNVKMHHTDNFFELWLALEKETGTVCNIPFWAIGWPAAKVLCGFISRNPHIVEGKSVLDLGCGCGIVGITSKMFGATTVTLNDIDPLAVHVAKANAAINNIDCKYNPDDLTVVNDQSSYDVIFTADCFYEKNSSNRLYTYLLDCKNNGVDIVIADAHRPFTPHSNTAYLHTETVSVDFNVEGIHSREVNVFRLGS